MNPMLKAILDYSEEIGGKEIADPALEALAGMSWRGPGFSNEQALDVEATRLLLGKLRKDPLGAFSPKMT